MKRLLLTLLLCMVVVIGTQAKEWDDALYKQIEQSIQAPQFADKAFLITKYGAVDNVEASPKLTARQKAIKNQKAIQKAI